MKTKHFDITGIDILTLAEQRNTLIQILEMFNTDIINESSFDMNDRDWQKVTAEQHCDTSRKNIEKSINLLTIMINMIADKQDEPNQINEANFDTE